MGVSNNICLDRIKRMKQINQIFVGTTYMEKKLIEPARASFLKIGTKRNNKSDQKIGRNFGKRNQNENRSIMY